MIYSKFHNTIRIFISSYRIRIENIELKHFVQTSQNHHFWTPEAHCALILGEMTLMDPQHNSTWSAPVVCRLEPL